MNGNELKAEIVRRGLTQREVAKAMGLRHESLSRILRHEVSNADVERIMAAIEKSTVAERQASTA